MSCGSLSLGLANARHSAQRQGAERLLGGTRSCCWPGAVTQASSISHACHHNRLSGSETCGTCFRLTTKTKKRGSVIVSLFLSFCLCGKDLARVFPTLCVSGASFLNKTKKMKSVRIVRWMWRSDAQQCLHSPLRQSATSFLLFFPTPAGIYE